MFKHTALCFLLVACAATAADRPATKALSGPASDFQSGFLKTVDMSETAIRSKSALLPIELEELANDVYAWKADIAIDSGDVVSMMVFTGSDESWEISMRAPNARRFEKIDSFYSEYKRSSYGIAKNKHDGDHFTFENIAPGNWSVRVIAKKPRNERGFLLLGGESNMRLISHRIERDTLVGNPINFLAYGLDAETEAEVEGLRQVSMRITNPYGETMVLPMDNHNGRFANGFVPNEVGKYQVQVIARGQINEDIPFLRTSEHSFEVVAPDMILADQVAFGREIDATRMNISLPIETFPTTKDHHRVFAEVWGKDAAGNDMPVNWIGGMVYHNTAELSLSLDARWIAISGAQAPFELRNIRIEDPDNFVAITRADKMALNYDRMPVAASAKRVTISEDMLMGPRPEQRVSKGSGSRLLLVHGYCSGNAWGSETDHFTGESVFLDLNKNRSHDQFAQLIRNFGNTWNSYGIVAHSQGGAASLHLYTYYWSGLDNASGGRLIQSVGTPYQGTALAGNLAAIGDVFGAGCGTNNDLTYSGASSWLSGIPSWARSGVTYYTTSFATAWWRYDYCHLATDLFLSDPEDGTTEKSKGQLSGANNGGHKTGWCHTTSMRDPGQTTDGGRNNTMNSNAAR